MINSRKKGFTLVELVIVIAVVAILAAVLIPTFSSLVKRANMSADQQAVRQMNTALAIDSKPEDFGGAVILLDKAGYNAVESVAPISKGYNFYWMASNNTIVLVDENLKVVFPTNLKDEDLTDDVAEGKAHNLKKGFVTEISTPESIESALEKGQSIKLEDTIENEIKLDKCIEISKGDDVVIDLNGKTLVSDWETSAKEKHDYAFKNYGTLTIKNGTIESRGIMTYGNLIIEEGVTIKSIDNDGGQCINAKSGTVVINGGTFIVSGGGDDSKEDSTAEPTALKVTSAKVTINGGSFTNEKSFQAPINVYGSDAEVIINDCVVTGYRGAITVNGGNLTINGGSFTNNHAGTYAVYTDGGLTTIKGGTFTSAGSTYCSNTKGTGKIILPDGTEIYKEIK